MDTTEKQTPPSPAQQKAKSLIGGENELNDKPALQSTLAATPELNLMTDTGAIGLADDKKATNTEASSDEWKPTPEWIESWKSKLPLQTIMRLLQVLVPQVEKICIDK